MRLSVGEAWAQWLCNLIVSVHVPVIFSSRQQLISPSKPLKSAQDWICVKLSDESWPRPPRWPRQGWASCQNKQACGVSRAAESPLQQDVTSGCDITGKGRRLFVQLWLQSCSLQLSRFHTNTQLYRSFQKYLTSTLFKAKQHRSKRSASKVRNCRKTQREPITGF